MALHIVSAQKQRFSLDYQGPSRTKKSAAERFQRGVECSLPLVKAST